MAWGEVNLENQKVLFIQTFLKKEIGIAQLSRQFRISRQTAYDTIKIFNEKGLEGLKIQSKRPHHSPYKTSAEIEDRIIIEKLTWTGLGPDKILARLQKSDPSVNWPSSTTIGRILNENGLVKRRKLRKRVASLSESLSECNDSNDIWCIDFKGWWRTSDGIKYEPFTMMDAFSRYLLCCQRLKQNNSKYVWGVFERLFKEFGLPNRVRSDNGSPFATKGAGRFSKLSVNLIKAGVMPEWIEPGNPQQNGRHERMHSTLKQEAVDVSLNAVNQTKKLNEFVEYYNYIRPHAAIEQQCPGEIYTLSSRVWDGVLRSPEYGSEFSVGKVRNGGKMRYKNKDIYVGRALENEPIGLIFNDGVIEAYYGSIYLGIVEDNRVIFERIPGRKRY